MYFDVPTKKNKLRVRIEKHESAEWAVAPELLKLSGAP